MANDTLKIPGQKRIKNNENRGIGVRLINFWDHCGLWEKLFLSITINFQKKYILFLNMSCSQTPEKYFFQNTPK